MKSSFTGMLIIASIAFAGHAAHAQANLSLSNLTAPTAVNVSLLPATTNSIDLGSFSNQWRNAWFSGDAIIHGLTVGLGGGGLSGNVAIGSGALYSNTAGIYNTATGYQALHYNTTGVFNTATGFFALYNNNGISNTAYGDHALFFNTAGNGNTANGSWALSRNTTGSDNTANGGIALYSNTTGATNTATGVQSLYSNTTGSHNTATGYRALYSNTTGNDNTAVGDLTNFNVITGGYNNSTLLGNGAIGTASNQVRIGNSSVTSIGGYSSWANLTSDGRINKNMKGNVPGLAFINKLRPVTYNLDLDAADRIIQRPEIKDKDGNIIKLSPDELDARVAKEKITYSGFVAQDVEKTARELGYDFSGVDAPGNDRDLYGLRYSEFVVPLVKAVQELDAKNEALKAEGMNQQKEIDELKATVAQLQTSMVNLPSAPKLQDTNFEPEAILGQNIPNPFDHSTLIPFRIPKNCQDASILISSTATSEVISVIPVSSNEDHVSFDAGTLASGTYTYSLYVNGKIVDTKQIVLVR